MVIIIADYRACYLVEKGNKIFTQEDYEFKAEDDKDAGILTRKHIKEVKEKSKLVQSCSLVSLHEMRLVLNY